MTNHFIFYFLIQSIVFTLFYFPCNAQVSTDYSENSKQFYEECTSRRNTNHIFDCDCLTQKHDQMVTSIMTKSQQSIQATGRDLRVLQIACEGNKSVYIKGSGVKLYPKSRNEKQAKFYLEKIGEPQDACALKEKAEKGEAIAPPPKKSRQVPSSNEMWLQLGNNIECRDLEKIYDHYYQQAKGYHKSNLYSTSKSEKDFCDCYANVFKEGLATAKIGSRLYVQLGTRALKECK